LYTSRSTQKNRDKNNALLSRLDLYYYSNYIIVVN
jgi:hypothetical protein